MEGFNFQTEVTVRFAETDAQGVAHNAVYLVWFEVARIAYLARYANGYRSIQEQGYEALTIESHVRYLKPVSIRRQARDPRALRRHPRRALSLRVRRHVRRRARRGRLDEARRRRREDAAARRFPAWLAEAVAEAEAARSSAGPDRPAAGRVDRRTPARRPAGFSFGFGFGSGFGFVPTRTIFFSPR